MTNSNDVSINEKLLIDWISQIGKKSNASISLLQAVQQKYGYLPKEAMEIIITNTEINASQLYGVATFYSQFRLKKPGKHLIKICHGTACHVRGADRINTLINHQLEIKNNEDTTADGNYTIENVACLGCCSLAPVMAIDENIYGKLVSSAVKKALTKVEK